MITIKKNPVILLTATIDPKGTANTVLQDPTIRKRHYLEAIDFYLRETECKIVVCENSGYPLHQDLKKYNNFSRLELITFMGNTYEKAKGKSFGEAQIIRYAIENSTLIKSENYLIKITGRVVIKNIKEIISSFLISLKTKNLIMLELWGNKWVQSVCLVCPKNWIYKHIVENMNNLDDLNYNIHHLLYEGLLKENNLHIKPIHPLIYGVSGKTGQPYPNDQIFQRELDHFTGMRNLYKQKGDYKKFLILNIFWIIKRINRKIRT